MEVSVWVEQSVGGGIGVWSCGQPRSSLESPQLVEELERVYRGSPNQVTTRVEVTCGGLWEFLRSTKLLGHKGLRVQSDPLVFEGVFLCLFV